MEPGWIYHGEDTFSGAGFKLGLRWSSKSQERVWIQAEVPLEIVNIDSEDGLWFNVDGDIVKLSSGGTLTDFDSEYVSRTMYSKSSKSFPSDLAFIKRLLDSQSVKVKIITGDGYIEGDFKADKPSAARRGFRELVKKVEEVRK